MNHQKVTFLNLGTYIDDSKGNANALFELTATLSPNGSQRGSVSSYNFLSFANTASPAGNTNVHTIGSIGINADGDVLAHSFENSLGSLATTSTTAGPNTVTISLDLTPAFYNGTTQFGKIDLTDSLEGLPGSTILTSQQSFTAITLMQDGTRVTRTDSKYSSLTLTQLDPVPEPSVAILSGFGSLMLLLRRRRA